MIIFFFTKVNYYVIIISRGSGEIGIHVSLRDLWKEFRVGSSPVCRTIQKFTSYCMGRFFIPGNSIAIFYIDKLENLLNYILIKSSLRYIIHCYSKHLTQPDIFAKSTVMMNEVIDLDFLENQLKFQVCQILVGIFY